MNRDTKLTAKETAQELGYHINHVYRLLAQGVMNGDRLGNYWLIDRDEVERLKALQDEHGRLHHGKSEA
jgi:excisionase family DNA binding protein